MPNVNDSSTTQRKRCTEKTAGLETLTKEPPPYGRDSHESLPKQTMEPSQETQIHSGEGAKATAEGHKGKSLKEKDRDLITTRLELVPKGDLVAKVTRRSERVRRLLQKQGSCKQKEKKEEDKGHRPKGDWQQLRSAKNQATNSAKSKSALIRHEGRTRR